MNLKQISKSWYTKLLERNSAEGMDSESRNEVKKSTLDLLLCVVVAAFLSLATNLSLAFTPIIVNSAFSIVIYMFLVFAYAMNVSLKKLRITVMVFGILNITMEHALLPSAAGYNFTYLPIITAVAVSWFRSWARVGLIALLVATYGVAEANRTLWHFYQMRELNTESLSLTMSNIAIVIAFTWFAFFVINRDKNARLQLYKQTSKAFE
jgi:hypothetical protein